MKKIILTILMFLLSASTVYAVVSTGGISHDSAGFIFPTYAGELIKATKFTATSTTVASTFPYASTTALSVSNLTSGNCVQAGTGGILTTVATACGSGSGGGGGVSDWQKESNFATLTLTPTTTIPVWFKDQVYASSSMIVAGIITTSSINATSTVATSTFSGGFAGAGSFVVQQNSGNVGVGITSPTKKFSIKCNGTTTGICWSLSDSSDSVKATIMDKGWISIGSTTATRAIRVNDGTTNAHTEIDARGAYWSRTSDGTFLASIVSDNSAGLTYTARTTHTFIANSQTNMVLAETGGSQKTAIGGAYSANAASSPLVVLGGISVGNSSTYYNASAPTDGMIIKGGVGIGSTSPVAMLAVQSANTASSTFALKTITAQTGNIFEVYNSSGSIVDVVTAAALWGMGTTSPYRKLSVVGDAHVDGDIRASTINATTTATVGTTLTAGTSIAWGAGANSMNNTTLSFNTNNTITIGVFSSGASSKLIVQGGANASSNLTLKSTSGAGGLGDFIQLVVGNNGGTIALTATSTGFIGIGTTTPYTRLGVGGTIVADAIFATSTTATSTFAGPLKLASTGNNTTVGNATLVAGTVTVNTGSATSASYLVLTRKTSGGTIGTAITYTITNGSFTINSDNPLDTSTFTWLLLQ